MSLLNTIKQLNTLDYGIISIAIFLLAVGLLVFYLIRKTGYFGMSEILAVKKQKETVVNYLVKCLSTLHEFNTKLIKQKLLIEAYDTDTIVEAYNLVKDIFADTSKFTILDNTSITEKATFYFTGALKMLTELKEIEQESYQFQIEYQQRVLFYNREFEKLKDKNLDEETLLKYKREILDELEIIRINVTTALTNLKIKRDDFLRELNISNDLISDLKSELNKYKDKEIKSKKFYPKYLAFI
jgi:hypothetical protein